MVASSRSDGASRFAVSLRAICNYGARTSIVSGIDRPARSRRGIGIFKFLGYNAEIGDGQGKGGTTERDYFAAAK